MGRLIQCKQNKNHWYCDHTTTCPWCLLTQQTGTDPFPDDQIIIQKIEPEIKVEGQISAVYSTEEEKKTSPPVDYRKFNSTYIIGLILVFCIVIVIGMTSLGSSFQNHQDKNPEPKIPTPAPTKTATPSPSPTSTPILTPDPRKTAEVTKQENNNEKGILESMFDTQNKPQPQKTTILNPVPTQIITKTPTPIQTEVVQKSDISPSSLVIGGDVEGTITIDSNKKNRYQWGSEIKLSGKNSISNTVYLFFVKLKDISGDTMFNLNTPGSEAMVDKPDSFTTVAVKPRDNSWSYTWSLTDESLQRTTCVVYAIANPADITAIKLNPAHIPHANTDALIIGAKPIPTLQMSMDSSGGGSDSF